MKARNCTFRLLFGFSNLSIGPLELTRRTSCLVHDDTIEIADEPASNIVNGPLSASIASLPPPITNLSKHGRASSNTSGFPPPKLRRTSTDSAGFMRPVPFSTKFQRVHPGTTGVTVLEHMERLDRVEASLERLVGDAEIGLDPETGEQDVGDLAKPVAVSVLLAPAESLAGPSSVPSRVGVTTELSPVREGGSSGEISDDASEIEEEEDVAALSKSLSQLDGPLSAGHGRFASSSLQPGWQGLEWIQDEPAKKRTVIVEVSPADLAPGTVCSDMHVQRLEPVEKKPLFDCW
jgi:phosphatidylinositol 4-kinase type 2